MCSFGVLLEFVKCPFLERHLHFITLSALPYSEKDTELNFLCPVRALRIYLEHSASCWQLEQLFISFRAHTKGHLVMRQRLSRWIVDTLTLAYSSLGLQCSTGIWAHSTRVVASSWALSSLSQKSVLRPARPRHPRLLVFFQPGCPCLTG